LKGTPSRRTAHAGKDYDPDEAVYEDDGDVEAYEEAGTTRRRDWEDDDLNR
jgi:hypothetical protein